MIFLCEQVIGNDRGYFHLLFDDRRNEWNWIKLRVKVNARLELKILKYTEKHNQIERKTIEQIKKKKAQVT